MGENVFRKNQYGLEVTHGTAVAATKRYLGVVSLPKDRTVTYPPDTLGIRAKSFRTVVNQILADGISLKHEHAVFDELPMLFSMGLKGGVTATEKTVGKADYEWDFTPSLTASNTPDSITLEAGDDTQAYSIEYVMAKRYVIAGKMGNDEAVSVEAECFGKQITKDTFTAGLLPLSSEPMIANMTKFWIDPAWATLGTTQKTGLIREFSLEILTGVHPKFAADGTKTMSTYGESYIDAMLTLVLEGNSDAVAQYDSFAAGTQKAVRLQNLGNVIGASTTPYSLTVDMFGTWEELQPLSSEQDGDNLYAAVFHAQSDNTATPHMLGVKVITNSNTI